MTVPRELAQPLAWVGVAWPEGDAARLAAAGDGWLACARALRERCTNCDTAAANVWKANRGGDVDGFRRWWTAPRGPSVNLAQAAGACALAGRALKAQAASVAHLKAAYTGCLNAMVRALDQGGFLVGDGSGGMAVRASAADRPAVERIRAQTRDAMREALRRTVRTRDERTLPLLDEAKKKVPRAPKPQTRRRRTEPRRRRGRNPFMEWLLDELLRRLQGEDGKDEPESACPDLDLPNRPWEGSGRPNMDTYPAQGHVLQISRQTLPSGARVIAVDGQVVEPQRDASGQIVRQGWERDITPAAWGMGIPSRDLENYPDEYRGEQAYHGSHLWGPVLGTEVREGILLAPASANLGVQKQIEGHLQALQREVVPGGGSVIVQARMETYGSSDWAQGHPMVPSGHNLVRSVDYDVFVCNPDGTFVSRGRFGYDVGLPTGSVHTGDFRAGTVTAVRWGATIPTSP
ncbi:polymorphic toxin type 4 domain-containing protein [Phytohabitans suffuscus]|uniref:Bacterial toxin 4 domain-containing protein n=1 Tax=Phytohabitans suffuscus TaxID=624315 RepID=A0A6F8YYG1_9ACTN|nr:polymorphic toxin type 4 domain-containing protein [Phytohabitans suffuscus]BCB91119.1 hypothetical protein Psuf_084320 [Phytohabitans suffuscus]